MDKVKVGDTVVARIIVDSISPTANGGKRVNSGNNGLGNETYININDIIEHIPSIGVGLKFKFPNSSTEHTVVSIDGDFVWLTSLNISGQKQNTTYPRKSIEGALKNGND